MQKAERGKANMCKRNYTYQQVLYVYLHVINFSESELRKKILIRLFFRFDKEIFITIVIIIINGISGSPYAPSPRQGQYRKRKREREGKGE